MTEILGDREKIRFNNYAGLWINERSMMAGVLTIALLASVGYYLSRTVAVDISNIYTPLLAAVFSGAATGHYIGAASEKVGETLRSFLLGFSAALSVVLLALFQVSLLSPVLLITLATVFLVHNSGMTVQNRWLNRFMDVAIGKGTIAGLVSLGVYHFVFPAAINIGYMILYDYNLISIV